MTVLDLWIAYFAVGGRYDATALAAYLEGNDAGHAGDHDLIAHALNETDLERGGVHPIPDHRQ